MIRPSRVRCNGVFSVCGDRFVLTCGMSDIDKEEDDAAELVEIVGSDVLSKLDAVAALASARGNITQAAEDILRRGHHHQQPRAARGSASSSSSSSPPSSISPSGKSLQLRAAVGRSPRAATPGSILSFLKARQGGSSAPLAAAALHEQSVVIDIDDSDPEAPPLAAIPAIPAAAPTGCSLQARSLADPSPWPAHRTGAHVSVVSPDYDPVDDAGWEKGKHVPYLILARTFRAVEAERRRLLISRYLCNMFRSIIALSPFDLLPAVFLCVNRIANPYDSVDLGVGGATLCSVIAQVTGRSVGAVSSDFDRLGDLGDVAQTSRRHQSTLTAFMQPSAASSAPAAAPRGLTVRHVFDTFRRIAATKGPGSQRDKKQCIASLLVRAQEDEVKYLVRTLSGALRMGAVERSVLVALADAFCTEGDNAERTAAEDNVRTAFFQCPSYEILLDQLLSSPDAWRTIAEVCHVRPGIPVNPMFANPATTIEEVLETFLLPTAPASTDPSPEPRLTAEFKYDGMRAQIHFDGTNVSIFSRHLENISDRFPDVADAVRQAAGGDATAASSPYALSYMLDAELVAYDPVNETILSFQTLTTRARSSSDTSLPASVQVCVFAFDCLMFDGVSLIHRPLVSRRNAVLRRHFSRVPGRFEFARSVDSDDPSVLRAFLADALSVANKCEGIMIKLLRPISTDLSLTAAYQMGRRSNLWLKVKKDYVDALSDTLDLVPIGAWFGTGRRAGWFSPYLLAVYNPETEEFEGICRCMTGFTDEDFRQFTSFFKEHVIPRPRPYYRSRDVPDVWFDAVGHGRVWELKAADLTLSPVHVAALGLVDPDRGISLRFPRFLRERPDRVPEDASTPSVIARMYRLQNRQKEPGS